MSQQPHNRSLKDYFGPSRKESPKPSSLRYYATAEASNSAKRPTRSNTVAVERLDPQSKKVVINGQNAILDSEDEDLDDELPELDEILKLDRTRPTPQPKREESSSKQDAEEILDMLIKETEENRAREARLAALDAELETERKPREDISIDEETIKAMLLARSGTEEDKERAQKTFEALKRTEALELRTVWHFFMDPDNTVPPSRQKFPKNALSKERWAEPLLHTKSRESSVRAGYISSLASYKPLPSELLNWILSEIPCEPRSDLVTAYIDAVVTTGRNFSNPLNSSAIQNLFARLGARELALSLAPVHPVHEPILHNRNETKIQKSIPPNTVYVVKLLRNVALAQPECKFPPASVPETVHLLILLSIDDSVQSSAPGAAGLREDIREAISALVAGVIPSLLSQTLERTALPLFKAVSDPVLQSQILAALPVCPPPVHRLRRRLALAWTLNSERWVKGMNDDAFDIVASAKDTKLEDNSTAKAKVAKALTVRIEKHLTESSEWNLKPPNVNSAISDSAMHVTLAARARILDIAIDDGFVLAPDALNKTSATGKEKNKADEIESHGHHISFLAAVVRDASAKIVTTGASHISRLEAKAVMDRLEQRLRHAVRRTPERGRDWYAFKDDDLRKWTVNSHDSGLDRDQDDRESDDSK